MNEANLKAFCVEAGLIYYDSELVSENSRQIYRVYVLKKGGISLDDCARLSEILSPILDVKPPCKGEYFLEVSSPGLERKLSKIEHFALSIGEKLKITTLEKEKFEGELLSVNNEILNLKLENGETKSLNFKDIKKAKTFVEW